MARNAGRYAAHGQEAEFEPGSGNRVLRNLIGIRSMREMARAESRALLSAQERLVDSFSPDHRFVSDDVREIHRTWLGTIYPWAGDYRSVNVAKGGFQFAAAREVPRLMGREFEATGACEIHPLSFSCRAANRAGTRSRARRIGAHPSIPRGKRSLRAAAGPFDGVSSRLAAARLQRLVGKGKAELHRGRACRGRLRLRANSRVIQRGDPPVLRPFRAARRLDMDLGDTAVARLAYGSRIPSIADDVLADTHNPSLRTWGSRR